MKKSNNPIPLHLTDFLDWLEIEKGLSSKSQENYARFLKKFLDWLKTNNLDALKPHELTPDHIWKYKVFLSRQCLPKTRQPLKKSTQNYYLIALRALLSYFAAKDVVSLPSDKIGLPKDAKREKTVKFLNLEQIKKLLSAPDPTKKNGLRDRAILESLFSTGLRIAELVSLNKEQFSGIEEKKDLELSIIGKGERLRTVYFSERALSWIKKYLETRDDAEKALFIHYRGKKDSSGRLTPRAIEKSIRKYGTISGLPITMTPHVMRHSFATDLLGQGVDLRVVQEFLGHKNISATQIYTHVTSKRLRDIHRQYHGGRNLGK